MSVGGAVGFDLSFLENLKSYDEQLKVLTEHTTKYSATAIKTFSDIATKGVEPTLKKLLEQKEAMESLSNITVNAKGFEKMREEIENTLGQIKPLISALEELAEKEREIASQKRDDEAYTKWTEETQKRVQAEIDAEASRVNQQEQNIRRQTKQFQQAEEDRYQATLERMDTEQQAEIDAQNKSFARQEKAIKEQNKKFAEETRKRIEEEKKAEEEARKIREKFGTKASTVTSPALDGLMAQINELNEERQRLEDISNQRTLSFQESEWAIELSDEIDRLILAYEALEEAQRRLSDASILPHVYDVSGESSEAQKYRDAMAAMREFYAEQEKEQQKTEAQSYSNAIDYSDNVESLEQERIAVQKLEAAREALIKTDIDYDDNLAELNKRIQEHNENIKNATSVSPKSTQELENLREQVRTLDQLKNYYAELEKKMNTLDPNTEEWKKLNAILQETGKKVGNIEREMRGVRGASDDARNSLGAFGKVMATVFSVHKLKEFANQIVNTYKEFESMQRALTVMTGSLKDANMIWEQTVDLAVKSPFQVQELFQYNRQLAAYRIENDKIFKTTKMLADVSAGLNVDMSRLILAYGQVKSAEYLRGTELRQFTEAGIPMLEELAKHLSNVNQKAVSTAEVFDMISKRMISFEDVNAVFENMTGEDGAFYKMQEEMSQTVSGTISNLKDELSLMFNEIGTSNSGTIKAILSLTKSIVQNWEAVAFALKVVLGLYAAYQIAATSAVAIMVKQGATWAAASTGMNLLSVAIGKVTAMWKSFTAAFALSGPGGWALAALAAIGSIIWAISSLNKESKKAKELQKKLADELKDELKQISKAYDTMAEHAKSAVKDIENTSNSIQDTELAMHKLVDIAQEEYYMDIKVRISGASEEEIQAEKEKLVRDMALTANDMQALDMAWATALSGTDGKIKQYYAKSSFSSGASTYGATGQSGIQHYIESIDVDFERLSNKIKEEYDEKRNKIIKEFREYDDEFIKSLNIEGIENNQQLLDAIEKLDPASVFDLLFKLRAKKAGKDEDAYFDSLEASNQALWLNAKGVISVVDSATKDIVTNVEFLGDKEKSLDSWFKKGGENSIFGKYAHFVKGAIKEITDVDVEEAEKALPHWQNVINDYLGEKIDMGNLWKEFGVDENEWDDWLAEQGELIKMGTFVETFKAGNEKDLEKFAQEVEAGLKESQTIIDRYKRGIELQSLSVYEKFEYMAALQKNKRYQGLADLIGLAPKQSGYEENIIKKRIDLIRDMYKRYTDEYKLFGAEAKQIIQDSYKDAFKSIFKGIKINFEDINFTSPEGVAESLEKLRATAKRAGKKYVDELEKAIAEFESQANSARRKNDNQRLVDTIQSMFDDYELTLDLKEIFVSADLGKTLFDVDFTNYEQLYANVFDTLLKNRTDVINELLKELEDSYPKFKGTMDKVTLENLDKFKDSVIKTNGTELYYKEGGRIGKGAKEDILEFQSDLNTLILTVDAVEKLRAELQKEIKDIDWTKITNAFGGDLGKEIKSFLDKLNSMYDEKTIENMKKYMEYTRSSLGDAAKARLEYLTKVREINDTFKEEEEKGTAEEIANIKKRNAIVKAERDRALTMAKQDMERALMELEWDNFTSSETFTSLLGDMSMASDDLLRKVIEDIDEFRKVWGHLPLHEMEEVIKLREKAEAALSASEGVYDRRREIKSKLGETTRAQAEKDAYEKAKAATDLEKHYENLQLLQQQLNSSEAISVDNLKQLGLDAEKYTVYLKDRKKLEEDIAKIEAGEDKKDSLAYANKEARAAQDKVELFNELSRLYEAESKALSDINSKAQELYGAFKEIHEALGEDGDSWPAVFSEMGMQMTDVVLSTMSLRANLKAATTDVEIFGRSMNAAMGVVGWIVMGVQLLAKVISAIAKAQDNKHVKTIEAQAREIDKLKKSYDKLAESMDEAWSVTQMAQRAETMKDYTEKMIAAQEKAIEAQEKRKGANIEGSDTWKELQDMYEELDEMQGQYAEDMKDVFSSLTDGILDSVTDAAREFTDAWYDAFKETGDGLSGLNETFDEMLANLTKNLVSRTLTTQWVNQWTNELKSFINPEEGVFSLDAENIKAWAEKVRDTLPALSAALEGSLEVMKDVITTEDNNLSELQKGIQGVTEQTAQVIEALLNSMRAEVQSQTRYMKLMWEMMSNAYNSSSTSSFNVRIVS